MITFRYVKIIANGFLLGYTENGKCFELCIKNTFDGVFIGDENELYGFDKGQTQYIVRMEAQKCENFEELRNGNFICGLFSVVNGVAILNEFNIVLNS